MVLETFGNKHPQVSHCGSQLPRGNIKLFQLEEYWDEDSFFRKTKFMVMWRYTQVWHQAPQTESSACLESRHRHRNIVDPGYKSTVDES